jgi:hypothetical protein
MVRAVLAVLLSMAAVGCGAASQSGNEQSAPPPAVPVAKELPCEQLPAEANCPGYAPARPVPMSPNGPVRSFESEYLDTQVMMSSNGVYGVAATAPGTFALTGTVADGRPNRPPYDPPIENGTVTFSSVSGPGLPAPPGGAVRVTTKTGYDGAFAVINLPTRRGGTCYRMTIVAPGVGRYESVDVSEAGVYDQSIELDGGLQIERPGLPLSAAGRADDVDRACARTLPASR